MRQKGGIALALCLLALLAAVPPAQAQVTGTQRQREIEKEKAALKSKIRAAESRARNLSAQIKASDARRAALERQINEYTASIAEAEVRLAETEVALNQAHDDLFRIEGSLTETLQRLEALRRQLNARTRETYKAGPGAYVGMLLGADSFRSFVSRLNFVSRVFGEDRTQVSAVEHISRELDRARAEAAERKNAIAGQKAAIEQERAAIEELRGKVSGTRVKVASEIASRTQLLRQVQSEGAEYVAAMQRLEEESRTIAALLKARQRGQVYQAGSGRRLAWPTTGPVSSAYGWRTHPTFGDRRFHAGIDISAPSGQAVISAEAGEVIFVGVKGGYGLTVIIDHGNTLATLYAHLSRASVGAGSRVGRASTIGAVGCSGYCTGPHLHFETRLSGDPVNPMQFF